MLYDSYLAHNDYATRLYDMSTIVMTLGYGSGHVYFDATVLNNCNIHSKQTNCYWTNDCPKDIGHCSLVALYAFVPSIAWNKSGYTIQISSTRTRQGV